MSDTLEPPVTPEEYLVRERAAEYKNELVDGQIRAMTGASRAHVRIVGDLFAALHSRLRGGPCEVLANDMRVGIAGAGAYLYPDLVAHCEAPRFEDAELDTLLNPAVVVEVLSKSTERYDRGEKFALYRRLESLREYVLVDTHRMHVEHFAREGERWLLTESDGPEGVLALPSLGCSVPLREIYERVQT